jgi:hypothetical protein
MTQTAVPEQTAPERDQVDAALKTIKENADKIFTWNYARERPRLVSLYNRGTESQWRSVSDLDWAADVDPEKLVAEMGDEIVPPIVRAAAEVPGSPLASWGDKEFNALGVEFLKARLSQFMHGEQGAMMTAAKIVETVPWIDAKYFAATQTMDEARHTEVFARYLDEKVGEAYPMSPFLEGQIDNLLSDSRWDIAYLGMQVIIESLALAAFGQLQKATTEPLLHKLLRYVMADEARHVAFGVLTLGEYYQGLSYAELKDRQEFLLENSLLNRARSTTPEVWERFDVSLERLLPALDEARKKVGLPMAFGKAFFSKLVPNVSKLGLLDANNGWLREKFGEHGLLQFEFADDTGTDYETYDEVAKDRAALN